MSNKHAVISITLKIILASGLISLFSMITGCTIKTTPNTDQSKTYTLNSIDPR